MAIQGKFDMLDVDGYSPPRLKWANPSKNYYVKTLLGDNQYWGDTKDRQCRFLFFNIDDTNFITAPSATQEINVKDRKNTAIKDKPRSHEQVGGQWEYASSTSIYVSLNYPYSETIVETNNPQVLCKLYAQAKRMAEKGDQKIIPWITGQVKNGFKFTGNWDDVDCDIPRPTQCVIPPSIDELLKQNDKNYFVIVKAKPSLHHSLYLFNANTDDIVYSTEGDTRTKITALRNVPRYNVFECKWQPAGKATFRFSDCSDDLCESKNAIIANGLDQLIKTKIGNLYAGNENQFLAQKFPTCCSSFDKDSTLAPQIKDELDKYKKTFYLLGMKDGEKEPKLYLFDLGQVQGGVKYSHILQAVVLKNENCKWVEDSPLRQNLKFSELKGEVDTNFYLLTPEKLEQPSTITTITLRKANEYLLKYIPVCSTKKPEGGSNPNDNLKPDFGNGGNGGIGGSGGEGFFPDVNRPLPNPEIPPCSGQDGGSQTPVSEIYLLSVPELSPSYDDTYDFAHATDQVSFFKSKRHFKVINYSYLRKESAIQVGSHVDNLKCYNYLMYKNKAGKWYYCFIMDKQYINERTARIVIATDVIQTYMFDYVLAPCYVERCHVDRWQDDGVTPTDEFEPEGLEFGEPIQVSWKELDYAFNDTFIAVCANPLGEIPSRAKKKEEEKIKGVDENDEI